MSKILISFERTSALIIFLFVFILTLFAYILKVNSDVDEYKEYQNSLTQLNLLDKSFDNFLLKKQLFTNYDKINNEISAFKKNLEFLSSNSSYELHQKEYIPLLKELRTSFKTKENVIETFKSESAFFLNSIHYIFDLNRAIQEDASQTQMTKKVVLHQMLLLMKHYANRYIDTQDIEKNFDLLNEIVKKEKNNLFVKLFIMHASIIHEQVKKQNPLESSVETKESLSHSISKLQKFLQQEHAFNLFIEKIITVIFFLVALSVLSLLFFMHRRSLRTQYELLGYKSAVENSDNSIVMTDADKNIVFVNAVFEEETGYKKEELIGQNPRILKSGEMKQEVYDTLNAKLNRGEKWEGELINIRKDKTLYYEKASITPIFVKNKIKYYLAIKLNITNYVEQKDKLEFLALHDTLTTLPNRLNIEQQIQKKIKAAQRSGSLFGVLFIDLDRFKIINDTLGHDVGDELLIQTAQRLKDSLRESDTVARLGGDEFLILLDRVEDIRDVKVVCEKIIELFSQPIETKNHSLNVTFSIGVSLYPEDGLEYNTLLKNADIAMYEAKDAGKNTYRFYQKQLSKDVQSRLEIEQAFNEALLKSEFFLHYQPKYRLQTRELVSLEALVRWDSSTLGSIPPDKFIPIAEDTGFILKLGAFIFKKACQDFLLFQKECSQLKSIAINISAVQLQQDSFVDEISTIIKELKIAPQSITLEITETYIMKNIQYSTKVLKELQAAGFGISIDDFGTGQSSLSYLQKLPINEIKIDK